MRLGFHGAAGEVTGSCYLLETGRARILVDFGLHQGGKTAQRRNRRMPPIEPAALDAVVLTHAHIDHSGRLPLLPRNGYAGRIHATPATCDLTGVLLRDAAHVQAQDAERVSRRRERQGRGPVAPLYTIGEAETALRLLAPLPYGTPREIARGVTIQFHEAGHILGSAWVEVRLAGEGRPRTLLFSGDLGPRRTPLLRDPDPSVSAEILVMESTYGDRDHRPRADTLAELLRIMSEARTPDGRVLVPAFAVGRTQQIIFELAGLSRAGGLDGAPVFVDSPMALETTDLYRRHSSILDPECRSTQRIESCLTFPSLRYVRSADESRRLNVLGGGVTVIAASGMCTGGRILHHLKHGLWKPDTHIVFVGFQAEHTLGRRLVDGARAVKVMGEPIAVKAKVHTLGGFSAHAGRSELLAWLGPIAPCRPRVFLTHGEERARRALGQGLEERYGLAAEYPAFGQVVELG